LARIPEKHREVIVLKIWGELTFAQIAAQLGESPNTVASRYRYGLEHLKKLLADREERVA
jgi:RNA polymerase sigma-70 factor (ECF subfamily)